MKLIETGTPTEMDVVRRLPYEKAPSGFDRLLGALETAPERFARDGWRASAFWKLFQPQPRNAALHAALRRQLQTSPGDAQLQELADEHLSAWKPSRGALVLLIVAVGGLSAGTCWLAGITPLPTTGHWSKDPGWFLTFVLVYLFAIYLVVECIKRKR